MPGTEPIRFARKLPRHYATEQGSAEQADGAPALIRANKVSECGPIKAIATKGWLNWALRRLLLSVYGYFCTSSEAGSGTRSPVPNR